MNTENCVEIRPYREEDRPFIENICIGTGARGQISEMFSDTDLFAKLWLDPYLVGEPENCFVITENGAVIGYLVATLNPNYTFSVIKHNYKNLLKIVKNLLLGRYKSSDRHFVKWLLFRSWRETPKYPKNSSHFHFNIAEGHRGDKRVGFLLRDHYEHYIKTKGFDSYYGILFTTDDKRSISLYKRLGYNHYDSKPCSLFPGEKVFLSCITKQI